MENRSGKEQDTGQVMLPGILATAAVFSIPLIRPEFGWLHSLMPLPVFYYLILFGSRQGIIVITRAMLIAGGFAILFGSISSLIFSFTLLPAGFILAQAGFKKESPVRAGFQATTATLAIWLLFSLFYSVITQTNLATEILNNLDQVITRTQEAYKNSGQLPAETGQEIEAAFKEMRQILPQILPALLAMTVISTIWLNLLLGHVLLRKKTATGYPWPAYQEWRLPEYLVWGVIGAITAMILPVHLFNIIGTNLGIIMILLYFYQGLAVFSGLLEKWLVPTPLRIILYGLILVQVFSILLLALLGLTDIWINFNRKKQIT